MIKTRYQWIMRKPNNAIMLICNSLAMALSISVWSQFETSEVSSSLICQSPKICSMFSWTKCKHDSHLDFLSKNCLEISDLFNFSVTYFCGGLHELFPPKICSMVRWRKCKHDSRLHFHISWTFSSFLTFLWLPLPDLFPPKNLSGGQVEQMKTWFCQDFSFWTDLFSS